MKQKIVDPNGSDRRTYIIFGMFICGLSVILPTTNPALPGVAIVAVVGGVCIAGIGILSRPYVVLDRNGVTYRWLFRKRFYRWDEVDQVGIRNTKATKVPLEYLFAIVIVFPNGAKYPLLRKPFHAVLVPNRKEIRELVAVRYGHLDFDDTDSLNNWERSYYSFQKK